MCALSGVSAPEELRILVSSWRCVCEREESVLELHAWYVLVFIQILVIHLSNEGRNAAVRLCRCLPRLERTLSGLPLRRRAYSPLCHLGPQYVSEFN